MTVLTTREQVPQIVRGTPVSPFQPQYAAAGGGFTGRDVLRVLRKRKWMIILFLSLFTIAAAATTILWGLYAPFYAADAYLLINPPKQTELNPNPGLYGKEIMDRLVMSQARLVKSEAVLQRAIQSTALTGTGWYARNRDDAIQKLADEVIVTGVPGENFIRISMKGIARTPKEKSDLPEIVNAVARAFVADSKENVSRELKDTIDRLGGGLTALLERREAVRKNIADTVRTAQIPNMEERRNTLSLKLQALTAQLTQLELAHSQAEAAVNALAEQEARGLLDKSPYVQQAVETDMALRILRQNEAGLVTELDDLLKDLAPKHPNLQSVEARLASIRRQADERKAQVTVMASQAIKDGREAELASLKSQLVSVGTDYMEATAGVRDLQTRLTAIQQLNSEQENLDSSIRKIEDRLVELRLLAEGEVPVAMRREATVPRVRYMPRWSILMPVGIVLGLMVGLGLAFLLEFIDTSIKGPSDVSRRVDLPLLGTVPHTADLEEEIENLPLAFMTHPNSLIGESFRQIRTCLLFSGPTSQHRSLLVTSSMPQDGRGTVTMNLAAAIARGGRRVLVVDANFRQPMIRKLFPQCPSGGLSSALVGQANWDDLLCHIEPNLSVLSSGPMPPNPSELLGSEQMRQILAEMVGQYDQVLFDGSPCLIVTDAPILSTLVDGVILVVRAGANTFGIVQRTRDVLLRVGAHIVGVVLNGVRATAGGYFRESYDTFYEYRHDEKQLPAK